MVGIWTVLTALAPILAPVISLLLVVIGRIIWNHEQRLRNLEKSGERTSRTLYGDEDDPQQTGLAEDIRVLIQRVDQVEDKLTELSNKIDEMNSE